MAHPNKAQAHSSSRDKFKAITGVSGGGHAYHGGSHLKKPGAHGVHKHWSGHEKTHILEGKAHGGRSSPRADKYARGGRTKRAAPENVTINVTQRPPDQGMMRPPMPPPAPPPGPPGAGAAPPAAAPMPPGGAPGGPNPMAQGLGKGLGFARGGRTKGAHGGRPSGSKAASGHGKGVSIGDSNYDLSHWREYAGRKRGEKAEDFAQAHTQPISKVQARARGGGIKMTAGAMSGLGRLEQAEFQKRHHGR